jgi:capsular exopolysaccharide synthesis family protein
MEHLREALNRARAERAEMHKGLRSATDPAPTRTPDRPGPTTAAAERSPIYTSTRTIALDPDYLREHRVITDMTNGEAAEAYKILRTQVLQRLRANNWTTMGITATRQGHGKTLTSLNLAICLAMEVNQTVLLADLDLRRPSLARYLCKERLKGLSDYLIGRYDISEILINPGIERLVILPGNEPLINSSEQLSSPRMVQLVEELKTRYPDRIVLFDLPPLLVGDDVIAFAPNLDAVMLVLEEGKTTRDELVRAYELLDGQRIIGTVLNKSVFNAGMPGYGGYSADSGSG